MEDRIKETAEMGNMLNCTTNGTAVAILELGRQSREPMNRGIVQQELGPLDDGTPFAPKSSRGCANAGRHEGYWRRILAKDLTKEINEGN